MRGVAGAWAHRAVAAPDSGGDAGAMAAQAPETSSSSVSRPCGERSTRAPAAPVAPRATRSVDRRAATPTPFGVSDRRHDTFLSTPTT